MSMNPLILRQMIVALFEDVPEHKPLLKREMTFEELENVYAVVKEAHDLHVMLFSCLSSDEEEEDEFADGLGGRRHYLPDWEFDDGDGQIRWLGEKKP